MDIATIASVISSVGFPIAACCYMFYLNDKQNKQYNDQISKLRSSLDNNTRVMNKILNKIDNEV